MSRTHTSQSSAADLRRRANGIPSRRRRRRFSLAFGRAVGRVDAMCLMTDGDRTGALVEGWYGDITLQAR
jgi:hypothetical protein